MQEVRADRAWMLSRVRPHVVLSLEADPAR